ncbi:peptide-methionine (S)-S-oxide reductase MsrA [Chamaesiphon minutus]|uniref:Peptide methionine sulfoxide reductase MsrA n=1 Tax=Chamaesiphon minutus (strain ATCC 27169 / PCC 6605) TaxID=1173020 RepID=K9UQR7_CHAP6|nr:peptide-methionine (S)-S-oxide reductase MsrA [Chamaesiphon minutus]AFY97033.1 methionine-S-sulfoxide reductase [Chamaesiphon minutus PCC 6605]
MTYKYPFLFSLSILSLIIVAYGIPHAILSSPVADSAPVILAGIKIDPPVDIPATKVKGEQTIVLAGGCFWGIEAVFEDLKGVSSVVSGYSGGTAVTANYNLVSTGMTDHAEAVKITYDPQQISYGQLLKIYFLIAHDPTQVNRQEPDSGTQYRSAIFFNNPEQQQVAKAYIDRLNKSRIFPKPIATQVVPLTKFYAAEEYHQNFIVRNPTQAYIVRFDLPKLAQLRQQFPNLIKKG